MRKWETLLQLKEQHDLLGFPSWHYFILEFSRDLQGNFLCVIARPTFTGLGIGPGLSTFVVTEDEIKELFNVSDKTFNEYAEELEQNYFEKK